MTATRTTDNVTKLRGIFDVCAQFDIRCDGTDETTKILAAVAAYEGDSKLQGKTALWRKRGTGKFISEAPVEISKGRHEGEGSSVVWRGTADNVMFDFRGAGGLKIVAPSGTISAEGSRQNIELVGITLEGLNADALSNGLTVDASASAYSYIEGIYTDRLAIQNFPKHQLYQNGTAFAITHKRFHARNPSRAGDQLVKIENGQPSQVTFDDPFLAQYTEGKWCAVTAGGDIRWIGGTAAPYAGGTGANGIQHTAGNLQVLGTHVEGNDATHTGTIGIRYVGSGGGIIAPSQCALLGYGVVIGDGTAAEARGWTIGGSIGNNNTGVGGADILITNGGNRSGVILPIGFDNGAPVILDNRRDIDGTYDVLDMHDGNLSGGLYRAAPGTSSVPSLSFANASTRGFYNTGSGIGWAGSGGQQGEFNDVTGFAKFRAGLYPGTPAGAFQTNCQLFGGTGAPSNANGNNGDLYFNAAGGSSTTLYQKRTGAWVGIV